MSRLRCFSLLLPDSSLRTSLRTSFGALLAVLLSGLLSSPVAFAQQDQAIEQYKAASAAYQSGNFAAAEKLWSKLADQGNANAQYAMGIMHLKKEAQGARDQIAFRYLVDAAKNRHVAAMFNLGVAYWEGRGTRRQPAKAANWWELAAEQQDAGAQYNLGLTYYLGEGREQDASKAKYWLEQAMQNGHPQAKPLLEQIASISNPAKPAVSAKTAEVASPAPVTKKSSPDRTTAKVTPPGQAAKNVAKKDDAKTADKAPVKASKAASVIAVKSALKAAPNNDSATLISLQPGTGFKLVKRGENWSKIQLSESFPLWVHETLVNNRGNGKGEIKGNNVNIRPTPSTDKTRSPALGQLNKGDIVSIRSRRGPWLEILSTRVFPGWVRNDAITAP